MEWYKTAKLWLQYMEMVQILRDFIRSARTGNWALYLHSLQEMLPFLASSGHNNYTKSLVLFLAKMEKLSETHPEIHTKFNEGYCVVRRSAKTWAGIFPDLCIEQGLMGSVKKTGGLSRVRGFDEVTRLVWLLSTPICASVIKSMHSLVGLDNTSKDTHQDISKSTIARDLTDTQTILEYFTERDPFSMATTELHSLSSGIIAGATINVHESKMVGEAILMRMANKSVKDHSFKQADQVINLNSKLRVAVGGGSSDWSQGSLPKAITRNT